MLLIINPLVASAQQKDLVRYVNPLQGTNSHWGLSYGNTYPTIAVPFPVHSWSPQTGKDNVYIQSATLNNKPLMKNFITYADIINVEKKTALFH